MTRYYHGLLSLLFFAAGISTHAQHGLRLLWETDTAYAVPESVLPASGGLAFYVSLVDGKSMEKDGVGGIALADRKGRILRSRWADGLNAPKGMAVREDRLYVADLDALAVIDRKNGKLIQRIPVPAAGMLNDVTVSDKGLLFVSDSKAGRIYRVAGSQPETFMDKLVNPNGLLWQDGYLYYLDSGFLYRTKDGVAVDTLAAGMAKDTDGLQYAGSHSFLASAWSGLLYFIDAGGRVQLLLDTRAEKVNTADFYYDRKEKVLYVPTFYHKTLRAYRLEQSTDR